MPPRPANNATGPQEFADAPSLCPIVGLGGVGRPRRVCHRLHHAASQARIGCCRSRIDARRCRRQGPRRLHPRALRQARVRGADARRHQAAYRRLHAEGRRAGAPLSDPDAAHAVFLRSLRRGQVRRETGADRGLRTRWLHLRLPGRAREIPVGRRVREHAPGRGRDQRQHRCLGQRRLDGEAAARQQRPCRAVGHLLSRLLHRGVGDRYPSGAGRALAAGADRQLVPRR